MYFWSISKEEIVRDLFPNFLVFLVHLLAAIILLIIISRFLYRPTRKHLEERRKMVQKYIDHAREQAINAGKHEQKALQKLQKINQQKAVILKKALTVAENKKNTIINQAHRHAELMHAKTKALLLDERRRAEQDLRKQIIETALTASQAVIKLKITPQEHQQLIEQFITEL